MKKVFISAILLLSIFCQKNVFAATPKEIIEPTSITNIGLEQVKFYLREALSLRITGILTLIRHL